MKCVDFADPENAEAKNLLADTYEQLGYQAENGPWRSVYLEGSVDLYFGPEAPTGKEKNWIKTTPAKGWFTYFRLYGPKQEYFDKSWQLNDIEEVK